MYNNLNACVLFLPLIIFSGELHGIFSSSLVALPSFWILLTISGFFGFFMGYVTGWQIQATSALTHNISGTAKAAVQTVLAVFLWNEIKPLFWWISNLIVLLGSALYTWVQKQDMDRKYQLQEKTKTDTHDKIRLLAPTQDDLESGGSQSGF